MSATYNAVTITVAHTNAGLTVCTNMARPAVGKALSPPDIMALELMTAALRAGCAVHYDPASVPLVSLAMDLLHPEALGHAVTPEVRQRARDALGERSPGVDMDAVHRSRAGVL